jgi:uncharacterized membrane protein YgaE (UPF0421/DUF939 family)
MWEGVVRRLRDPLFWNDAVQLAKTVLAAVLAWLVATVGFELSQPFLAPWAALLVVHATVYRTFSRGLQQVSAAVVAVFVASAVGHAMGPTTAAVAAVLVICLLLGSLRWFGDEATTVATTGLVVLTTGFTDDAMLFSRLLDTGIGIVVGLLVNVAVWPPLRSRAALAAMDRIDDGIGELMVDMAAGMRTGALELETVEQWIERTRDLDEGLDQAWAVVRQAEESAWMNPRRRAREARDPQRWHGLLRRMEQAIAEVRSMARTWDAEVRRGGTWDTDFTDPWSRLLGDAGQATADADADAIHAVRGRLERLVDSLGPRRSESTRWPTQGALVINLRNILDAMDEVAAANPLGQPPPRVRLPPLRPAG